ncbi:MAG: hypothetical protein KF685_11665, partial [Acidobacteria bacterium]|nr:hypothetical protein [Acidobacteriota bacterium]
MKETINGARQAERNANAHTNETKTEQTSDTVKLPASQKIYIEHVITACSPPAGGGVAEGRGGGSSDRVHSLRVPFREIALTPSKAMDGTIEENPPVRVYDTSGPWTDPHVKCDVRDGLPQLRREWIIARGDVEEYEGREVLPQDNGYLTKGAEEYARVSSPP